MGGAINVVVREKDGTITKMCRWTNTLTNHTRTTKFLNNPDEALKDYIKAGENSEYNHDEVTLSPDGYGLVVFDAVNRLILTKQNYTSFSDVGGAKYCLSLHLQDCLDFNEKDSIIPFINLKKLEKYILDRNSSVKNFFFIEQQELKDVIDAMKVDYDFFMAGAIRGHDRLLKSLTEKNNKKLLKSSDLKHQEKIHKLLNKPSRDIKDWKEFLKIISNLKTFNHFSVSTGEFNVINYDQQLGGDLKAWNDFKSKLIELGFGLTEADLKDWDTFLSDYEEDDDE